MDRAKHFHNLFPIDLVGSYLPATKVFGDADTDDIDGRNCTAAARLQA
jgi:hypothetical protein